jgi:hypothetical protein
VIRQDGPFPDLWSEAGRQIDVKKQMKGLPPLVATLLRLNLRLGTVQVDGIDGSCISQLARVG